MVASARVAEFAEQEIDAILAEVDQCHLPGAAVGIAIGGRPVYRKGFGLANMESPAVLSPATRIRIASITKHFTCLAYLLLCEEGKAGLDDPLGKHLPELNPAIHGVTMRQLMGHTSGIRDVLDISWYFSGTAMSACSEDLLSLYRDINDLNAAPGTEWSYSNGGYLLLSAAIERISAEPLETLMARRIFQPIGMHDTFLRRTESEFLPRSAARHMINSAGRFEKSELRTATAGEGGIVSTVDDMLRWLEHMDAPEIGSVETWRAMRTPQRLANGVSTGYGLGLLTDQYRGVETLSHSGGLPGVSSQMLKVPAIGLDVIVLVNRSDVSSIELANRILDHCVGGLAPVPRTKTMVRPLALGTFRSPTSGRVIQFFGQNGQQMAAIDGGEWKLDADDEGTLRPLPEASWYKVAITLSGDRERPDFIKFNYYGNSDELLRENVPQLRDVDCIVGSYRSRATGNEARILNSETGATLTTVGRFGTAQYKLECIADRIWHARSTSLVPAEAVLSFGTDERSFRFSTWRTRSLLFLRDA